MAQTNPLPADNSATLSNDDVNQALQGAFVLMRVKERVWEARVNDRSARTQIAAANGASEEFYRVYRGLLENSPEYKELKRAMGRCRTFLYENSTPWVAASDGVKKQGPRLVPTHTAMAVMTELSAKIADVRRLRAAFAAAYPQRVAEALAGQGQSADPSEYPDVSEIEERFDVTFEVLPVPTVGDLSRTNLPAKVSELLADKMAGRQRAMIDTALDDLRAKLVKTVGAMATQLTKLSEGVKGDDGKGPKIYKSLVTNVKNVADLLAGSSALLGCDETLREIQHTVADLIKHDSETLKANPGLAGDVAKKAVSVIKALTPVTQPQPQPQPQPQEEEPRTAAADESAVPTDDNPEVDPFSGLDDLYY